VAATVAATVTGNGTIGALVVDDGMIAAAVVVVVIGEVAKECRHGAQVHHYQDVPGCRHGSEELVKLRKRI